MALDLEGKVKRFRRGEMFDCPEERLERLGNSVKIVERTAPVTIPDDAGEEGEKPGPGGAGAPETTGGTAATPPGRKRK